MAQICKPYPTVYSIPGFTRFCQSLGPQGAHGIDGSGAERWKESGRKTWRCQTRLPKSIHAWNPPNATQVRATLLRPKQVHPEELRREVAGAVRQQSNKYASRLRGSLSGCGLAFQRVQPAADKIARPTTGRKYWSEFRPHYTSNSGPRGRCASTASTPLPRNS